VALSTATADPIVIEYSSRPTDGRMAHVAFEVGGDVLRRLALRLDVVVAGRAAPVCLGVVEVDRRNPGHGGVAAVTLLGREDVIRGLRGGPDARAQAVARRTFSWCPLEDGTRVALLALQIAVPAGQLETGRQVIEIRPLLSAEADTRQSQSGESKHQKQN
jgi:hypothetical protein